MDKELVRLGKPCFLATVYLRELYHIEMRKHPKLKITQDIMELEKRVIDAAVELGIDVTALSVKEIARRIVKKWQYYVNGMVQLQRKGASQGV